MPTGGRQQAVLELYGTDAETTCTFAVWLDHLPERTFDNCDITGVRLVAIGDVAGVHVTGAAQAFLCRIAADRPTATPIE